MKREESMVEEDASIRELTEEAVRIHELSGGAPIELCSGKKRVKIGGWPSSRQMILIEQLAIDAAHMLRGMTAVQPAHNSPEGN
jgi:hypothetical protein